MPLPIKKIYIDSKHKVSGSNSDFRCQLKDSYLMPENAVFKIVDVAIPHSWTTIMTGINSKLYLYLSDNSPIGSRPQEGYILNLDSRNYTGAELALTMVLVDLTRLAAKAARRPGDRGWRA